MTFLTKVFGWASPRWRTMNEWLVEYEKIIALRDYSPQTVKNKRICIKHIRELLGDRALREIQPHHLTVAVKTFLPDRATTAQKIRDELVDIFREAAGNGWTDKNPAEFVKRPPAPVLRKRNGEALARPDMLSYRFEDTIKPLGEWVEGTRPSLHECRSLSARLFKEQGDIDTQTLLGHKHKEMTEKYEDERDLNAHKYKPLILVPKPAAEEPVLAMAA